MGVIRFSDEEVFGTDSQEYEILFNAAKNIKGVEGAVIEIGTRRGGSAKIIMDALEQNNDANRSMFCIDPYGNIDLEITNINASIHYPNKYELEGDPMSLEKSFPTEFFKRYSDGVPVYNEQKKLENQYAFVFFDGPHTNEAVQSEIDFFIQRSPKGATWVFDDIWMYDHSKFEKIMFDAGFKTLEKQSIKASYYKT